MPPSLAVGPYGKPGGTSVVVRGTVEDVDTHRVVKKFFGLVTRPDYPQVKVRIDDEPFRLLQQKLGDSRPQVAQTFEIGWGTDKELPEKGARVWATFALANQLEVFFQGRTPVALMGIDALSNEADAKEGELISTEPFLPLAAVAH